MKTKVHNYLQKLNNRLFWQCYYTEKHIRSIFKYRFNLPSWLVINRLLLSVSLLLSTLPGIVRAEGLGLQLQANLEVINPVIKKIALLPSDTISDDILLILPQSPNRQPKQIIKTIVTFYCSVPWQTDDTPFITANGTAVYDGIAAANFLSFNTPIKLPDVYGSEKIFYIHDRMHLRFSNRIDIWMEDCYKAKEKGIKYTAVEIY
ncbi:MAG: hypothetical protein ABH896_02875 [Candidatus Jacksonbacteria bacterium]